MDKQYKEAALADGEPARRGKKLRQESKQRRKREKGNVGWG